MEKEYYQLEETIKSQVGKGIAYYIENPGNWGDGLIRHGTLKFFEERGISYKPMPRLNKKAWIIPSIQGGVVIHAGGGGWVKQWGHSGIYVQKMARRFRGIVLPSTFDSPVSIPNTTYFCRDQFESQANVPQALFCHDMAFFIGNDFTSSEAPSKGKGYFFRTDIESTQKIKIPQGNIDLSLKGTHETNVAPLFEELSKYSEIHTDRLHISIAGCLLGREVHLYSNCYFKNRAIYQTSIKGNFPNCFFHEITDESIEL